jgi:hypothetical protein
VTFATFQSAISPYKAVMSVLAVLPVHQSSTAPCIVASVREGGSCVGIADGAVDGTCESDGAVEGDVDDTREGDVDGSREGDVDDSREGADDGAWGSTTEFNMTLRIRILRLRFLIK